MPGVETFYLTDSGQQDRNVYTHISSGGALIDVYAHWIVDIDVAARALYHFLLTERLDPALQWQRLSEVDFHPKAS